MKMKRLALIGAGNIAANRHVPGFRALEDVAIVGVVSRDSGRRANFCRDLCVEDFGSDPNRIFDDPSIDAVCIATWPNSHCDLTLRALEKGKHVLLEGRMAMDAQEAHKMCAAVSKSPAEAWLVPAPSSLVADKTVIDIIASGRLGRIEYVRAAECASGFDAGRRPHSFRTDRRYSGMNMMFMGVLFESLLRWFGAPEMVTARLLMPRDPLLTPAGMAVTSDVPDHADIWLDFPGSIPAAMRLSNRLGSPGSNEIVIHGSQADLKFDIDSETLSIAETENKWEPICLPQVVNGGWTVERDFVNVINGGQAGCLTSFDEGRSCMEFTEAVWRSHQSQKAVSLPLSIF